MIDFAELKKFFLFNLIGSLIISAIVAVITVLFFEFNEITGRVFFTLLMVAIHSIISLTFIWNDERQHTFETLSFFINTLFILIILSFITSIFGIWKIIPGDMILKIYATYFVLGFAALHGNILAKALDKETYLNVIIYINYLFMALVVLMLQPLIYIENPEKILGEFFFRGLGALAIIDGTLSILTIIFYKLYMNKHPKIENPLSVNPNLPQKRGLSIWVWILIIYLAIQILSSFFLFGFGF